MGGISIEGVDARDWYEIESYSNHITVIRERLDFVDSRYYTKYTNMYVIQGSHSVLLLDTGTGLYPLRPLIEEIADGRDILVYNTHNHFDHIGANGEFDRTHIHRMDFKKLMSPMSVEFLRTSETPHAKLFANLDYHISFAEETVPLIGNEILDLGSMEVELFYTPGHTPGSICLKTRNGEIFTGDTANYGGYFLPSADKIDYLLLSIRDIINQAEQFDNPCIFPGHESYGTSITMVEDLYQYIAEIDHYQPDRRDLFLDASVYYLGDFIIVEPLPFS